jgi:molybdopterin converting factor small subunit
MTVSVLFFASLKETVGRETFSIELSEPLELPAFIDLLAAELAAQSVQPVQSVQSVQSVIDAHLLLTAESVRIAVNQVLLNGPAVIADGDEVAFLPPVTGG